MSLGVLWCGCNFVSYMVIIYITCVVAICSSLVILLCKLLMFICMILRACLFLWDFVVCVFVL